MKAFPLVSVIIPTLNEESNLKTCLDSIFSQSYPKSKLEVIIVDNFSSDSTLDIAKEYPVKIIMNKVRHGEVSKMVGFRKAAGKYAIYLDADVELRGTNWFQLMIKPLEEDSKIIGVFTRKYSRKTDPGLERYYSFDPLQRDTIYQLFSPKIESVVKEDRAGYKLLEYSEEKIPPAGRCLYRREQLLKVIAKYDMFLELDFLVLLTKLGFNTFAYVPLAGLYHHHAPDIKTLIRKRMYNVKRVYLKTYESKLYKWFNLKTAKDIFKIIFLVFIANTIFPSILLGIYKSIKYKDFAGMYEPVVNFLVVNSIIYTFLKSGRILSLIK